MKSKWPDVLERIGDDLRIELLRLDNLEEAAVRLVEVRLDASTVHHEILQSLKHDMSDFLGSFKIY